MNVIWHHFHHFDEHTVLCCCGEQDILESGFHVANQNLTAIFRTPDDVILEDEHRPGIVTVLAVRLPYNYVGV
jgi:hypothetical protein